MDTKDGWPEQPVTVSTEEVNFAGAAILRDYGSVIGEQQARNIAYTALVAARFHWFQKNKEKTNA